MSELPEAIWSGVNGGGGGMPNACASWPRTICSCCGSIAILFLRHVIQCLEPGEVIVGTNAVRGRECLDRGQQLPVCNRGTVHIVGVCVQHPVAKRCQMLLKKLDFIVDNAGACRRRLGKGVRHLRQPVSPVGGLTEFPAEFVDSWYLPGAG